MIHQNDQESNSNEPISTQFIRLSNDEIVIVPDGADPDYVRQIHEARIQRLANPRPKRRSSAGRSRPSKRRFSASTIFGFFGQKRARHKATAELVKRANDDDDDDDHPRFINGILEVF